MRKVNFINGEYYHIFNRGVDKRDIFKDKEDIERFFQSMREFNSINPIGSIYENSFRNPLGGSTAKTDKLVDFICYCLNPNHYHFILEQVSDNGIEKFMHRLGGYTWFFNKKYDRSGSLFQGRYKAIHIDSNEYLLYLSAYTNLNDKVHQLGGGAAKLVKSSWSEYVDDILSNNGFCEKDIILGQFKNIDEYKSFAKEALEIIKENKEKEMEKLLIE